MKTLIITNNAVLAHHGIRGQKWGVRRFQNKDGSVTSAGAKRYYDGESIVAKKREAIKSGITNSYSKIKGNGNKTDSKETNEKTGMSTKKKVAIAGAAAAGTMLAAYGTYKVSKYLKDNRIMNAKSAAEAHIDNNWLRERSISDWAGGKTVGVYTNRNGQITKIGGTDSSSYKKVYNKVIGSHNDKVVNEAKAIYEQRTNTKFDKGLNKIVNAGNKVGEARDKVKNKANDIKDTAKRKVDNSTSKIRTKAAIGMREDAVRKYNKDQRVASLWSTPEYGGSKSIAYQLASGEAKKTYDDSIRKANNVSAIGAVKYLVKQKTRR